MWTLIKNILSTIWGSKDTVSTYKSDQIDEGEDEFFEALPETDDNSESSQGSSQNPFENGNVMKFDSTYTVKNIIYNKVSDKNCIANSDSILLQGCEDKKEQITEIFESEFNLCKYSNSETGENVDDKKKVNNKIKEEENRAAYLDGADKEEKGAESQIKSTQNDDIFETSESVAVRGNVSREYQEKNDQLSTSVKSELENECEGKPSSTTLMVSYANDDNMEILCDITEKKRDEDGQRLMLVDPLLPEGWTRHIIQKPKGTRKAKVVISNSQGQSFTSMRDLSKYFDEVEESQLDWKSFNFNPYFEEKHQEKPNVIEYQRADKKKDFKAEPTREDEDVSNKIKANKHKAANSVEIDKSDSLKENQIINIETPEIKPKKRRLFTPALGPQILEGSEPKTDALKISDSVITPKSVRLDNKKINRGTAWRI